MTKKAKHEDSSGAFYGHNDLKHRINDPYQEIDGYAGTRYGYVSASRGDASAWRHLPLYDH